VTVGFHAPPPNARTGVADYAAALLGALSRLGRVEAGAAEADVHLYHLGNNQLHRRIYEEALERPGVAVLHDAVLMHFFLGALERESFIAEFIYNYGEWTRGLAEELWAGRARSAQEARYFRYPMLRRVAERSRALIVHNPSAARMAAEPATAARVVEIPHLFQPPDLPADAEVMRFRQSLGLERGTFLLGVFGHLRESKRLPVVVRAFERARRAGRDAALLVAGDFVSTDLQRAMAPLLRGSGILRVGYAPERRFWLLASAVDACVNLRYPPAGETSGIVIRLMGIGKPVVMSAGEETARFPEGTCLKVNHGPGELEMLVEYLRWLAGAPADAREIGRRASAHIHAHHALDSVARQYWQVLCASRAPA
jgi:glycosyltransferase involved in cell wall biosynthesis